MMHFSERIPIVKQRTTIVLRQFVSLFLLIFNMSQTKSVK